MTETYYQLNNEKNGVEIFFNDKPSEEIRNQLKANKFRWSNYSKCWYSKQSERTIQLAKQLSNGISQESETTLESSVNYPEIDINDNDTYTIDQSLQDREHDGNWIFRTKKIDHNKEVQSYFEHLTNEVNNIIQTTDNEYIIYQLKKTLQYFKKHYFNNYVARLRNRADSPSWAVTGRDGRNTSKDQKMNNRYDNLMREYIDLEEDYKKRINSLENKIRKDKENQIKQQVEKTEVDIEFKTETKEFMFMNFKEKKRVYSYNDYFICRTWNAFRIFQDLGNGVVREIHSMKTTQKLTDAKKHLTYLIQQAS